VNVILESSYIETPRLHWRVIVIVASGVDLQRMSTVALPNWSVKAISAPIRQNPQRGFDGRRRRIRMN
jgi:hypothetical protein